MSHEIKKALKKIFETRVVNDRPLTDEGFGFEITLQGRGTVSISPAFRSAAAANLKAIVRECGVLVIRRAYVGMLATHHASIGVNERGKLAQDPFHIDDKKLDPDAEPKVTALYGENFTERAVPTFYARACDVKDAIIGLSCNPALNHASNVAEALAIMAAPGYCFSLAESEQVPRRVVHEHYPEFTRSVFDAIPPGKKYAHYWQAGEYAVVLHPNDRLHIVHGRPESTTDTRPQLAAVLF